MAFSIWHISLFFLLLTPNRQIKKTWPTNWKSGWGKSLPSLSEKNSETSFCANKPSTSGCWNNDLRMNRISWWRLNKQGIIRMKNRQRIKSSKSNRRRPNTYSRIVWYYKTCMISRMLLIRIGRGLWKSTIGYLSRWIKSCSVIKLRKFKLGRFRLYWYMIQISWKKNWKINLETGKAIFNLWLSSVLTWMFSIRCYRFKRYYMAIRIYSSITSISRHFVNSWYFLGRQISFTLLI